MVFKEKKQVRVLWLLVYVTELEELEALDA
jgi:hypothetical protein